MEIHPPTLSRRSALGVFGTLSAAVALTANAVSPAQAAPADGAPGRQTGGTPGAEVQLLINGNQAAPGTYGFPAEADTIVLDNGLARFTFGRDDGLTGNAPAKAGASFTLTSVLVEGVELAHNLSGKSFYVDAWGGKSHLACTKVVVSRVSADLVDVAFVDETSSPLQYEHHLIMRRGRRGLYGYAILSAVADTSINEVRMNSRWDRSIFDHSYNWERGSGQQPTYAYLATQQKVQDETWRIDGINNPALPAPDSNSGNLAPGSVYSKYEWSLYHHENPMFGHYGHGFGVWFTPLGGVTDQTLCAFYGVGPTHQDLAIHQDAIILNYFGANHYGLPAYPLQRGYRRLYGPWYTYLTTGDATNPEAMIAEAAGVARAEIAENRAGAAWVEDGLYPADRTTVTGRVRIADGRPASDLWVLLSTQDAEDVHSIHEATYFAKTDEDGNFSLPGIPPAWKPGTTDSGSYVLYVFSAGGPITGQLKQTGISVSGKSTDLGTIVWETAGRETFLWQIGRADRTGGEFALAAKPSSHANPREYEKPGTVPGNLNFTVGQSWEPTDWYYAQTNEGTWTITFPLERTFGGTARLTVSTSMQQAVAPTVAVNGSTSGISGGLPTNNDSTIARQADRSGYPRQATLSFPASLLRDGSNTITLTRGPGSAAGNGLGWDTLVLEVDEGDIALPAALKGSVIGVDGPAHARTWHIRITNSGPGTARDVRLDKFAFKDVQRAGKTPPPVTGRDPNLFPVPVTAGLAPGASAVAEVTVNLTGRPQVAAGDVDIEFSADGSRTSGSIASAAG